MKTPAGKECSEYYADFHRGRRIQECRLAKRSGFLRQWQPADCHRCPVPDILRSNSDENMRLDLRIRSGFLGIGRAVLISAHCEKHNRLIDDPHVGCPVCNAEKPGVSLFLDALKDDTPE